MDGALLADSVLSVLQLNMLLPSMPTTQHIEKGCKKKVSRSDLMVFWLPELRRKSTMKLKSGEGRKYWMDDSFAFVEKNDASGFSIIQLNHKMEAQATVEHRTMWIYFFADDSAIHAIYKNWTSELLYEFKVFLNASQVWMEGEGDTICFDLKSNKLFNKQNEMMDMGPLKNIQGSKEIKNIGLIENDDFKMEKRFTNPSGVMRLNRTNVGSPWTAFGELCQGDVKFQLQKKYLKFECGAGDFTQEHLKSGDPFFIVPLSDLRSLKLYGTQIMNVSHDGALDIYEASVLISDKGPVISAIQFNTETQMKVAGAGSAKPYLYYNPVLSPWRNDTVDNMLILWDNSELLAVYRNHSIMATDRNIVIKLDSDRVHCGFKNGEFTVDKDGIYGTNGDISYKYEPSNKFVLILERRSENETIQIDIEKRQINRTGSKTDHESSTVWTGIREEHWQSSDKRFKVSFGESTTDLSFDGRQIHVNPLARKLAVQHGSGRWRPGKLTANCADFQADIVGQGNIHVTGSRVSARVGPSRMSASYDLDSTNANDLTPPMSLNVIENGLSLVVGTAELTVD